MRVRFHGVRGSIAVSGPRFARTGGNTTCVSIEAEGELLILDGGTGLRTLGAELGFAPLRAAMLFSHLHWDHIQGVPFFTPAFHPDSEMTLVGVDRATGGIRDALAAQMRPPQFPVGLETLVGARHFRNVGAQQPFELGPFRCTALDQNHPDGVVAWKVEAGGRAMVFATDIEHGGTVDPALRALSAGADLLVHDAQYTDAEYSGVGGPCRRGWGHSTWQEAVTIAEQAGVARLALFHHDPARDDDALAIIEHQARLRFPGTFAAREGMAVAL